MDQTHGIPYETLKEAGQAQQNLVAVVRPNRPGHYGRTVVARGYRKGTGGDTRLGAADTTSPWKGLRIPVLRPFSPGNVSLSMRPF